MNISLPNGKTITISTYEYLFMLKDEDIDEFYQSCMADDLGSYIENPFSDAGFAGRLEIEEDSEVPEDPID